MQRVAKGEWVKENGPRERSPPCGFPVLNLGRAGAGLTARHCAWCLCLLFVPAAWPGSRPALASVFDHIPDLSLIGVVLRRILLFFVFENPLGLSFRPRQLGDARHRWPDAVWFYPFGQAKELKFLDRAIRSQQSLICVCAALVRRYNQQIQVVPQVAKQGQVLPNE